MSVRTSEQRCQMATLTDATETALTPTPGAGLVSIVRRVIISGTSTSAVVVQFRAQAGGSVKFRLEWAANNPAIVDLALDLISDAGLAPTVKLGTVPASGNVVVNAVYQIVEDI